MRTFTPFMLVLATSLLGGCATDPLKAMNEKQAIDQVTAPFAQGAITLDVQTDPDLNALNGIANSCTLLVIQAQKSSTLNKLLSSPFALKALFSAAGAQDEILKVDRYPAMPGQSTTLHIDRSENTRYIAIVAGYYPFPQEQHMMLLNVPVTSSSTGWWHKTWRAQLAPLSLKLRLGSTSITQFSGATVQPLTLTTHDAKPAEKGE
ncbi:type VI secretion protein [Enterobacter roggenkampii]|uniref:type VI secretion system lipoprotein TssJ n=1 Tax=Enterobacter TaxID=547 RepID=UPI0005F921F4|nr:type VI secretion system lipoprotein TssJ [Enterobacter mori]KJX01431.1 type VI secretion protein [Enterobacter roggenkampii]MCG5129786.1 type VI secretion system lipoprotein TssJ [Enterobacter mori]